VEGAGFFAAKDSSAFEIGIVGSYARRERAVYPNGLKRVEKC
jgi:hypothetical protein